MTNENPNQDDSPSKGTALKSRKRGSELLDGFLAPRASVEERLAAGKALRNMVP